MTLKEQSVFRVLLLLAFWISLSFEGYVPGYDNRCWACLMDAATVDVNIYCPSDDRCYSSINDECASNFALNPYDCQKITA